MIYYLLFFLFLLLVGLNADKAKVAEAKLREEMKNDI